MVGQWRLRVHRPKRSSFVPLCGFLFAQVVVRKPIGVVVGITPWNYPLFTSIQKWAPARGPALAPPKKLVLSIHCTRSRIHSLGPAWFTGVQLLRCAPAFTSGRPRVPPRPISIRRAPLTPLLRTRIHAIVARKSTQNIKSPCAGRSGGRGSRLMRKLEDLI